MRTAALSVFLAGLAGAYAAVVGTHYGLPFGVRILMAMIAGGIIGWVMRKLRERKGD